MRFSDMLAMDVKPQPPTRPSQKKDKKPSRTLTHDPLIRTKERYQSVSADWIRTRALELALGMAKGAAFATLERYEDAGFMERRPFANLPYNQRRGWEWRWIK
jgi:hypothetical protein